MRSSPIDRVRKRQQNYVLLPRYAYDRSLAEPYERRSWPALRQTANSRRARCGAGGNPGAVFEGSYRIGDGPQTQVIPSITGSAYITGEGRLLLQEETRSAGVSGASGSS